MPPDKTAANLVFQPYGRKGRVESGLTILAAVRGLGEEPDKQK